MNDPFLREQHFVFFNSIVIVAFLEQLHVHIGSHSMVGIFIKLYSENYSILISQTCFIHLYIIGTCLIGHIIV